MKKTKLILAITLSTLVGYSDIITLQWKPTTGFEAAKKYVTVPTGKVCKILTMTPGVSNYGYVDAGGNEIAVFDGSSSPVLGASNAIIIAGPVKIFFKKSWGIGTFITLEIVDQNTPKSGVAFTDN